LTEDAVFRSSILALFASCLMASPAVAQETGGTLSGSELTAPAFEIQNVPPSLSYEFGVHMSFGTVTYWRDFVPAWIGFGFRFSGGKNLSNGHRLGASLTAVTEGPFGVTASYALEPHATWDHVPTKGGLQVGVGVGPALMHHISNQSIVTEKASTINPSAAIRLGYSQPWTSIGRRLYLVAEPKMRLVDGEWNPLVALVVGSGAGVVR
jgi:hypothetical protein